MRASPRTWPSIRFKRFSTDVLASGCMLRIYPYRVPVSSSRPTMDHSHHLHAAEATAIDPVCGMKVDPKKTPHRHTHQHQNYFFCSAGCRTKFAADPDKYRAAKPAEAAPAAPGGTIYICPMHPQIRQIGPGFCPICGMALEPEAGGADDGSELADMWRRFWISAMLTLPVFVIEMGGHFGLLH